MHTFKIKSNAGIVFILIVFSFMRISVFILFMQTFFISFFQDISFIIFFICIFVDSFLGFFLNCLFLTFSSILHESVTLFNMKSFYVPSSLFSEMMQMLASNCTLEIMK